MIFFLGAGESLLGEVEKEEGEIVIGSITRPGGVRDDMDGIWIYTFSTAQRARKS